MDVFNTNIWKTIPSLRIVLGLITGILFEYYFTIPLFLLLVVSVISIFLLFTYSLFPLKYKFNIAWIKGCLINIIFVVAGSLLLYNQSTEHQKNWIGNRYKQGIQVQITILEPLIQKDNFYKAIASIDEIKVKDKWEQSSGKVLLYLRKDSIPYNYQYGSIIITTAPLISINSAENPGGFDYKRYCLFQGISHQVFINSNQLIFVKNSIPSYLHYYLFKLRDNVLNALKVYLPHTRAYGVAEALLIGYRNDLDREIVQAYSSTGVVHIIAISGLHLGMLYGSLVLFFNLFPKRKWVTILKPIVILIIIWGFALIAGGVPSIMRSAFMFSFILVAAIIDKHSKIYNTLSLSALCMILYNPFCIWDVGFQLSYAAVLSIILYSGTIKEWFTFKNKILKYLWQLNAVTISAQIWTFPLIIYYFHQFPRLSIICNLIVVPISCIILYGEIILLMVGVFIPKMAIYAGKAVQFSIETMNYFIERMSTIKWSIWEGLKLSPLQTILLFFFIFFLIGWLTTASKRKLFMALGVMFLVLAIRCVDFLLINRQQKIIIYNISKYSDIELMNGFATTCYMDSILMNENSFLYSYHLKPAHIEKRAKIIKHFSLCNAIIFNNKRIVVIDRPMKLGLSAHPILVDLLIIAHNPPVSLTQLSTIFSCKQIVIDGSNSMWKTDQMLKENKTLLLPLYITQSKGAFIEIL